MNKHQSSENNNWKDFLKGENQNNQEKEKEPGNPFKPPKGPGRRPFRFSLWYFLLVIGVLAVINMVFLRSSDPVISYSDFKAKIISGEIKRVKMVDNAYTGYSFQASPQSQSPGSLGLRLMNRETTQGSVWKTIPVEDPSFVPLLESQGIMFYAEPRRTNYLELLLSWVVPFLLLMLVWRLVMRRMGGMGGSNVMSFGQNNAKIVAEEDLETRFLDVAGCDESKDELVEIVGFLKAPAKYTQIGGKIPKGALLVGPPGTGKTLLARAVAGEAGVTFFRMSGADFVEMFVGVGAARVRDLFKQARAKAPCIIFIDELDAIGKSRAGSMVTNDEREQTLNQLLVEMDGFDSTTGVIILAATNRPEILDPALLRPGRFDRQVLVDKPDLLGREAILQIHSREVKIAKDVVLKEVAKATPGFVGADLANIINEAALLAVRKNHEEVQMPDFEEAIEKTIAGLEKKNRLINPREREIVAYHETGHALVAAFTPDSDPVQKVSIVPRGLGALGYTLQKPIEDRFLLTQEELIGRIDVLLGGRAAEEIIYGKISTGASNDIMKSTDIARDMIASYGMSAKFPNVALSRRGGSYLQGEQMGQGRDYSENTQHYMDEEIARIMAQRYTVVKELLSKHTALLKSITKKLMETEVIDTQTFLELIKNDTAGKEEFSAREKADMKPSEHAEASGRARNEAILERIKERKEAEEEQARKAAEEAAAAAAAAKENSLPLPPPENAPPRPKDPPVS